MHTTLRRLVRPQTYVPLALAMVAAISFLARRGAVSDPYAAFDLTTFRIVGAVLLTMVSGALIGESRSSITKAPLAVLAHVAALAVLVTGLLAYLYHFEGTLMMAEGEPFEPVAAAFSQIKKGPLAAVPTPVFVLSSVSPDSFSIIPGAGGRTISSMKKVLSTDGVQLRLVKRAIMPLVDLSTAGGGTAAREYVRLDLDGPAGQDSFSFINNPFEFTMKRLKDAIDPKGVLLQVSARRGKLKVAEGKIDIHTPLKMEGLILSIADMKCSGILTVVRQPWLLPFFVSCYIFAALHMWQLICGLRKAANQ